MLNTSKKCRHTEDIFYQILFMTFDANNAITSTELYYRFDYPLLDVKHYIAKMQELKLIVEKQIDETNKLDILHFLIGIHQRKEMDTSKIENIDTFVRLERIIKRKFGYDRNDGLKHNLEEKYKEYLYRHYITKRTKIYSATDKGLRFLYLMTKIYLALGATHSELGMFANIGEMEQEVEQYSIDNLLTKEFAKVINNY